MGYSLRFVLGDFRDVHSLSLLFFIDLKTHKHSLAGREALAKRTAQSTELSDHRWGWIPTDVEAPVVQSGNIWPLGEFRNWEPVHCNFKLLQFPWTISWSIQHIYDHKQGTIFFLEHFYVVYIQETQENAWSQLGILARITLDTLLPPIGEIIQL